MSEGGTLLLVFVVGALLVTLIAVLASPGVRARLNLPGRAGFEIQVDKGWHQGRRPGGVRRVPGARRLPGGPLGAPRAVPRAWLAAKVWGGPDWQYPLDNRTVVFLGGQANNDIVLRSADAPPHQARIYLEAGRWKIDNLSAQRPAWVNGRPITSQNLGDGNTIQLSGARLIFRQPRGDHSLR